jgi:hypothetical protein
MHVYISLHGHFIFNNFNTSIKNTPKLSGISRDYCENVDAEWLEVQVLQHLSDKYDRDESHRKYSSWHNLLKLELKWKSPRFK